MQSYQKNKHAPFAAPGRLEANSHAFQHPELYCWSHKLNGHRALMTLDPLCLRSRKGFVLNHLVHPSLDTSLVQQFLSKGIVHFEGELIALTRHAKPFASGADAFLALSSAAAKKQVTNIQIVLFVFDVSTTTPDMPFNQRLRLFRETLPQEYCFLHYLPHYTPFVSHIDQVKSLCLAPDKLYYPEGLVVRPVAATYSMPKMLKIRQASGETSAWLVSMDVASSTAQVQIDKQLPMTLAISKRLQKLVEMISLPCRVTVDLPQKRVANIGTEWL
jgi:hypothetical protein